MPGALDGITALDLTQGHAGALAAMFLCDNGVRVIRVELPDAERREPGYVIWDRGKESVALDIAADADVFERLVRKADVLIESFAPASSYQAIVDYKRLSAINLRLVHCSITAYGKTGPLKDEPPQDDLVMARMGILAMQPGYRPGPTHVVHRLPSVGAALLAAQGVAASLYAREKTGAGRKVETSLMAGALMNWPRVVGEKFTPRPFQMTPAGGGPFYSVYECADGQHIQIACIHSGFVDIAAAVMDMAEIVANPRFGNGRLPRDESARKELFEMVAAVIKSRTYDDWAEIFEAADVPYARASTTEEAFQNPQVIHNRLIAELDDPEIGKVVQMGLPLTFSGTPGKIKGPRPLSGQHTESVMSELTAGAHSAPLESHEAPGPFDPPLAGVEVLEMTNVIAGPTAGKLLADYGADVIKLESPDGDISRPSNAIYFYYLNSGKRSVSVNARDPEGKEVIRRLAAGDVLVENLRPGAIDRVGLDNETLQKLNPNIIEAHINAFGKDGPFVHRPGLDPLAQAMMGLQWAQGGKGNPPSFLSMIAPTDYTAGAMCALGVIMALYVRERTGKGQRVDTNLLAGGAVVRGHAFLKYEGKPAERIADKGQHGLSALHRLYETKKGWLYLAAEDHDDWWALCKALERGGLANDGRFTSKASRIKHDEALAAELAQAFQRDDADSWVTRLRQAGVRCALLVDWRETDFFSDAQINAAGLKIEAQHPMQGLMKYSISGVVLENTKAASFRRTPLLGEHTREALAEAGYAAEHIEALHAKGVLVTEKPPEVSSE